MHFPKRASSLLCTSSGIISSSKEGSLELDTRGFAMTFEVLGVGAAISGSSRGIALLV